ncbi:hypothetical protein [Iningainema tapete]|uniref:Uncharacterized protein n=1 Tax=Iningainema tapete BLCC-T55 TaxID=2748662 RepID=A0A8J6XDZ2_9CYAN|nr:hypothetical protein [Iningainema tapete]MBD2770682.1 hypothetical protein [Iningainema tapete BLCC-T55]
MKIYEALRQALKEFEVPANKAAEICSVTKGFMSLFLSGKRSTPVENLDEWLNKLDAKYCGIKRFFYSLLYNSKEVNEQVNFNSATPETLVGLLDMDNESLFEMLSTEKLSVEKKIVQLIEAADDDTIEVVLSAIGRKWKRERQQRNNIQNNYVSNYPEESIAV